MRPIISDKGRVYSEAEFALILRRAAELASPTETPDHSSGGLTLAEMKAAAAEVGIDPALVERAARLLPASSAAPLTDRLIGGPTRVGGEIHLPGKLDEPGAARLLAAVQMRAGQPGSGAATPIGMAWHAGDQMETLSVTAEPDGGGTSIAIQVDRRGTLAFVQVSTFIGFIVAAIAGSIVGGEVGPALGVAAGASTMGGVLAVARAYWASSSKRVRQRIGDLMDAVGQVAAQPGSPPPHSKAIGASLGTPEIGSEQPADAG